MSVAASEYSLQCHCGRTVAVTKADAGGQVQCRCGQSVRVPRLSELRRQAGEAAYESGAVDRIRRMLAEGQLPPGDTCQFSFRPTKDVLLVTVECETPYARRGCGWWSLLFIGLFSLVAYRLAMQEQIEAVGRETVLRLPLLIDAEFQPQVRRYSASRLSELLRAVPIYAQLLAEFPRARVYVR